MVIIEPPQAVHMHRDSRRLRKALHAVRNHLAAQVSNPLALEAEFDDGVGAVGEVDDGAGERFIERAVCGAETGEADGCAKGFFEGGAKGNADIFCGVVVIDCNTR